MTCISIIVPCYHSGPYLPKCLDSLLSQEFSEPYNIILVDCKGDEQEQETAKEYQKRFPDKIFYYRYETNLGPSLSRNLGLRHANGAFVTFVDGDDYVSKDYLSSLLNLARKKKADIVTRGYYLDYGNKIRKGYSRASLTTNGRKVLKKYRKSPLRKLRSFCWGRLYRTSYLRENRILFDTTQVKYEDLVFFFRVRIADGKAVFSKKPVYYYHQNPNSIRHNRTDLYSEHLKALRKAKEAIKNIVPERTPKLFKKEPLCWKIQLRFDRKSSGEEKRKEQEKEIFSAR